MLPARKRNFQIKKQKVFFPLAAKTQSVTSHHFQIESDRNAKTSPTQLIFASSHTTTHTTTHTDTHTDTHTSPHHHITTHHTPNHRPTRQVPLQPHTHKHTNTQCHPHSKNELLLPTSSTPKPKKSKACSPEARLSAAKSLNRPPVPRPAHNPQRQRQQHQRQRQHQRQHPQQTTESQSGPRTSQTQILSRMPHANDLPT